MESQKHILRKGAASLVALFVSAAAVAAPAPGARGSHAAGRPQAVAAPLSAALVNATIDRAQEKLALVEPKLSPEIASLMVASSADLAASAPVKRSSSQQRIIQRLQNANRHLVQAKAEIASAKRPAEIAHAYNHARRAERDFTKANSMLDREGVRR